MKLKVQKKPQLAQDYQIMTKTKEQEDYLDYNCEECENEDKSVVHNLILYGFKICNSCNISKKIFPL